MSKRKADHDFITNRDFQILLYSTHRFEDELKQLKKKKKKNNTTTTNNNNNNNNGHVNVFEDNRGPPMPDLMVRKMKEMMNMNDDNDDDNNNNNNNESFMKRIVWLGQKKIEVTDTNAHHNRLFFPKGSDDKLTAFCSDEENRAIRVSTENTKNNKYDDEGAAAAAPGDAAGRGLYVRMVDGEGDVWREAMLLKWWQSVNKIVFTREWNAYVADRKLKPGVLSLQLWCFRDAQNKLCFAVNAVPTIPAN
ncbi:hypothetical protein Syun_019546 [Stephania yunnanensis]|uniref:TF-B3 domain-containing protein n=1 Tax=Stephania yunnanensis TaxID=152371 RepID=A0AAP0NXJ5_9MAGN